MGTVLISHFSSYSFL